MQERAAEMGWWGGTEVDDLDEERVLARGDRRRSRAMGRIGSEGDRSRQRWRRVTGNRCELLLLLD